MSIDALKKTAKKLHRALQEGKSLTLMQVQHLLAQSHGYANWEEALEGISSKKAPGPEKHVVLDPEGFPLVWVGLSDLELEQLAQLVEQARLDPDFQVFTNYRVLVDGDPKLQARIHVFPDASPEELDHQRELYEKSRTVEGQLRVWDQNIKTEIYKRFYETGVPQGIDLHMEVPIEYLQLPRKK